jgi:GNAT superfamily N-acetyltransferase
MHTITFRLATLDDVTVITRQRHKMFVEMGTAPDDDPLLLSHDAAFADWLPARLPAGQYVGWVAENERGENIGGAGLWIMDMPPHPLDPTSRRGLVMNVYVEPAYRRRGLARQLVNALLDWSRDKGIRILTLNASHEGRGLYESLGFHSGNDMTLYMGAPE